MTEPRPESRPPSRSAEPRVRRRLAAIRLGAVVCLAACLGGCAETRLKGGPGLASNPARPAALADAWRPRPVDIAIYPSSRFERDASGRWFLETRIELLDALGDPIKSSGRFMFRLTPAAEAQGSADLRTLYAWTVDVVSREQNAERFDDISQAYRFRLSLDESARPLSDVRLSVELVLPSGRRLRTLGRLSAATGALEPADWPDP